MNTKMIVALVLVGLLSVGGIFAFAQKNDIAQTNTDSQESTAESSTETNEKSAQQASLLDTINTDDPYTATVTFTDSEDSSKNGQVEITFETAKLWSVKVLGRSGESIETIYADGATYVSGNNGWTKFPAGDLDTSSFENYALSQNDLESYSNNARKTGTAPCSLGTCDVWEVSEPNNNTTGTILVGPNQRIAEFNVVSGTTTTVAEYDYSRDSKVTPPKKFKELAIPSLEGFDLEDFDLNTLNP